MMPALETYTSFRVCVCVCHQYIETLDLSGLISITDDSSQDRNLDAVRLNLQMKDGNIKFTVREYIENISIIFSFFQSNSSFSQFFPPPSLQVPSAEARELWKGFIHSVTEVCEKDLSIQVQEMVVMYLTSGHM